MTLAFKSFNTISTKDDDLALVQRNVEDALNPVLISKMVDGNLLVGVSVTGNVPTILGHRLGRPVTGLLVVKARGPNHVMLKLNAATLQPTINCSVTPSATGVIDVWVF